MKKLIALTAALLTVSSFAGNRSMTFTTGFTAATEAEVVALAEAAIPSIQEGEYKEIVREMRYNQCWPIRANRIKIGSMSISKYYKVDASGNLNGVFVGRLAVRHTSCRDDD
tara:strand:+ start:16910 stop:17245 length:336 start_codon:yes stop_codon:yes gene_type:complete